MMQKKLAFVDSESASIRDDAILLSFGMTISEWDYKEPDFQWLVDTGFYVEFHLPEQKNNLGRKSNKETLKWWSEQSKEARQVWTPKPTDVSILDLPRLIQEFLKGKGIDPKNVDFFDRNQFDMPKLQKICEDDLGGEVFWQYGSIWEVATALRIMGFDRYGDMPASSFPGAIYHNSLHDAAMDHVRFLKAVHGQQ